MQTLRDIKCGTSVIVKSIRGGGAIKRRIMDMGITKGTTLSVNKIAPLGDPIGIKVRGYELSIGKDDAEMVEVV